MKKTKDGVDLTSEEYLDLFAPDMEEGINLLLLRWYEMDKLIPLESLAEVARMLGREVEELGGVEMYSREADSIGWYYTVS